MVAATPFTWNTSQLLDLHRASLARFKAVTLLERLVNGRKTISLFIKVPMDNARRRRRPKNGKMREKDRQRKQEKKRSKEVSPHPPSPTKQPAPAKPDSPLGWFDQTIPQLVSCGSSANCSCSQEQP